MRQRVGTYVHYTLMLHRNERVQVCSMLQQSPAECTFGACIFGVPYAHAVISAKSSNAVDLRALTLNPTCVLAQRQVMGRVRATPDQAPRSCKHA